MKRGGLVLLVMVLATGVFRMVAPSTPGTPSSKSGEASKTVKPPSGLITKANSDLFDTIRQFYGTTATGETDFLHPDVAADSDEAEDHLWVPKEDHERENLRFMVAFVPDPVHTYLGLQFDRSVDAIQQAAQAAGCDFDRAEVPWDAAPPPQPSDPGALSKLKNEIKEREKWPGLLIFRKHIPSVDEVKQAAQATATAIAKAQKDGKDAEQITEAASQAAKDTQPCDANLFVLLVGETPTGGIRKEQFRRALTFIKQIRLGTAKADDQPLYLLGPTFSGSLHALDAALKENNALVGTGQVSVFSGTVTNWHAQEIFLTEDKRRYFATFQENDKYLINSFAQLACDLHYKKGEIAILSEDETEFGDPVQDNGLCSTSGDNASKTDADGKPGDNSSTNSSTTGLDSIVNIHFPREISQLRGAYQSAAATNDGSQAGRSLLPLDLELSGDDDDNVPDFAKVQTPVSQEAVLLAINGDLHKHHTKLILLLATDPMDQLFLAQFLRRTYPAARVGISAPDVLFTREGSSLLHGTFAVSAYALVPGVDSNFCVNEVYAGPTADVEFPSVLSQGLYNATIGLLKVMSSKVPDDRNTIPAAAYLGYGRSPKAAGPGLAPALKLSLLGRDGYWLGRALDPIRAEPPSGESSGAAESAAQKSTSKTECRKAVGDPTAVQVGQERFTSSLKPQAGEAMPNRQSDPHQPPSLNLAILLVMALAALHAFFSLKGGVLGMLEAAAQFDPKRGGDSTPGEARVRDWLVGIGGMVLATAAVMLVTARIAGSRATFWNVVFSVVLVVLLLVYMSVLQNDLGGRRNNRFAATVFRVATEILIVASVGVLTLRPKFIDWLWAPRSVHMTSGCSALLALLLLLGGAYWWVWYSLRGLVLADRFRPLLPKSKDLPPNFIRLSDCDTLRLRELANPMTITVPERCILLCAPLLLLVMPDRWHLLQTLEGGSFDRCFVVLMVVIGELQVWTLVKLILIWGRCRPMLMAIDRLPLRDVFKALDGFPWSSLWSPGSSTLRESYRYVSRQFESLTRLLELRDAREVREAPPPLWFAERDSAPAVFGTIEVLLAENDRLQAQLQEEVKGRSQDLSDSSCLAYVKVLEDAACISGKLAQLVLHAKWNGHRDNPTAEEAQVAKDKAWFAEDAEMVKAAGEYVALTYVSFFATVMVRLRSLVVAAAGIYVFLLLGLSVYPFEPTVALFSVAVGLYIVSGLIVAYVYAAMLKDPTLVRLTTTADGEMGMQFWMQIAAAGAIPLLTLLAGQVPAINQVLVNFLEPAMQAVK